MSNRVMSFAPPQALQAQESPDTLDDEADAATDEPPDAEPSAPSGSALAVVPGGIATGHHRLTTMNRWAGHRDAVPMELADEPIGWRGRGPRSTVPIAAPPPAGTTAPSSPAVPAQPRRDTGERPTATAYVGERPVDADWLAQRESALKALRADYEAARAAAQATPGSGPGWIEDRRGNRDLPASDHRVRVELPDGRTMVFSEDAFAAHFKAQLSAQPSAALKALATCYETDAATLLTRQPGLWTLAMKDHAPNAGPPPPGRAMGDADQLGKLDLYLADPQIAALIAAYGGTAAPARGAVAQEQVRLFGAERFAQLCRLNNAMGTVRQHYSEALAQAQQRGSGPGWREQQQTVTETDEAGTSSSHQVTTRSFDPDAFTAWYIAQDGLANEAFAAFYGRSHTSWESDDMGRSGGEGGSFDPLAAALAPMACMTFDNAQWTLRGVGGAMSHTALHPLNINDTPRLHDRNAVGFDLEAGWVTHPSNVRESRDWFETAVQAFIVGVVSYASFTAFGPAAASAVGLTTTGAAGTTVLTAGGVVVASAVAGATTTAVSGAMNGNFAWRDVLTGALAGGLSAGLMSSLGPAVQGAAGPAGTIALRTTVQGGIQALLGGKFSDGAIAGFASGLADLAAANMASGIEAAVEGGKMTAAEAFAARSFARVVGSAIRALGNPNDPGYAFASAFVNSLMPAQDTPTPGVTAGAAPALDNEGNLMPGVVDANAPPAQQALQLAEQLERQGLSSDEAAAQAMRTIGRASGAPVLQVPVAPEADGFAPAQTIVITGHVPRDALGNAYSTDSTGQQIVRLANGGGMLALGTRAVPITGNSATPGMALLRALAAESLRSASTLLTIAGNTGLGGQRVHLDETTRFESRPGELNGRVYDRLPDGSWQSREGGYVGFPVEMGFRVLSDEELRNLRAPISTPALPPRNSSPPPLPVGGDERDNGTPGYGAAPPAVGTPGMGAAPPVTVDDLIIERRNSEILGGNLEAAGQARPEGYEAHHIVPSRAGGQDMEQLRQRLGDLGLNLNEAANGVWLPGVGAPDDATGAYHPRLNNTEYNEAVLNAFRGVTTLERARQVLADIGSQLQQGGNAFPGIRPRKD
jgi:A nuclease family of the HNH/ENDO VII superfamily with conserved AHH